MSDALSRAFAEADAMRAKAATSSPSSLLASGGGIPYSLPSLGTHAEQYRHFKGWAWVAVRAIAQRVAGQDLYVARRSKAPARRKALSKTSRKALGDLLEPLTSHPLLDAIDNPNPLMTRWSMMFATVAGLELTGRAYWWYSGNELWPLPATWVEPTDNFGTAWKVRPFGSAQAIDVPGEEIAHFCLPDPSDPFKVISPLQSQALAVATDEQLQTAQHRSFRNGVNPQLLVRAGRLPGMMPGQPGDRPVLEPEQRKELIEAIRALYRGAVNHGEPLIVDGMIEGVDKLSATPAEMDYLSSSEAVKSRILQAFGVNPAIVGQLEGANRASTYAAEQHFAKSTVNPLIELLSQTLTRWASNLWGERLAVWLDPCVPFDDELWQKQLEFGVRMGIISGNEYRAALNLEALPGLDELSDPLTGSPRKSTGRRPAVNGNGRFSIPGPKLPNRHA